MGRLKKKKTLTIKKGVGGVVDTYSSSLPMDLGDNVQVFIARHSSTGQTGQRARYETKVPTHYGLTRSSSKLPRKPYCAMGRS